MIIPKANSLSQVSEYYLSRKLEEIRTMNLAGADVINLGIGSPDLVPSEPTIESLIASARKQGNHGYQSYRGVPELRNAIAEWNKAIFGIDLNGPAEILPLMGSKEGIMHISMAFLNEGDEVLIPDPGYPTYSSVSKMMGAKIRTYEVSVSHEQAIDIDKLRNSDLSKVKLMWVNFPHMPTGRQADISMFRKLAELAKEKQFLLCHDNPYSLILNDNPLSIFNADLAKEVAVELNSFSKSHNMAGWRLGWVAGREDYINTILTVKSNFDSGMFLPIQHAAIAALKNGPEWHEAQNAVYEERRELAWQLLDTLGCSYSKDQAGMFVWAKLPKHISTGEAFVDDLLQKAKVFITPGSIFGQNGADYVRVSLCSRQVLLMEAISRVKIYLSSEKHLK